MQVLIYSLRSSEESEEVTVHRLVERCLALHDKHVNFISSPSRKVRMAVTVLFHLQLTSSFWIPKNQIQPGIFY